MIDEFTKRLWEIAEEIGMPVSKEGKLLDSLRCELREHCSEQHFHSLLGLILEWRKSRNPFFMDAVQMLCKAAEIPITQTLQDELADVAKLRLEGWPSGTAENVKKQRVRNAALTIMTNLRHTGRSVPEAANLAEIAVKCAYKADSLAKFYNQEIKPEREAELHASWDRTFPDHQKIWDSIAQQILSGEAIARAVSDE